MASGPNHARAVQEPDGYPPPRRAWYVVAVLTGASIFAFIDRQILSLLVAPIRRDLEISDTQMSLLLGAGFAVCFTLFAIPIGRFADRRRRRAGRRAGGLERLYGRRRPGPYIRPDDVVPHGGWHRRGEPRPVLLFDHSRSVSPRAARDRSERLFDGHFHWNRRGFPGWRAGDPVRLRAQQLEPAAGGRGAPLATRHARGGPGGVSLRIAPVDYSRACPARRLGPEGSLAGGAGVSRAKPAHLSVPQPRSRRSGDGRHSGNRVVPRDVPSPLSLEHSEIRRVFRNRGCGVRLSGDCGGGPDCGSSVPPDEGREPGRAREDPHAFDPQQLGGVPRAVRGVGDRVAGPLRGTDGRAVWCRGGRAATGAAREHQKPGHGTVSASEQRGRRGHRSYADGRPHGTRLRP